MLETRVQDILIQAVKDKGWELPADFAVEPPPTSISADLATNLSLQIAQKQNLNPREVAEDLQGILLEKGLVSVEIAGPGFLNMVLSDAWLNEAFAQAIAERPKPESKGKINVEFISANPTGPLHIGNARGGPVGESIARVLEWVGYEVSREYYVNDIGGQADKFATSVLHFAAKRFDLSVEFPEGGYPEVIVGAIAAKVQEQDCRSFVAAYQQGDLGPVRNYAIDQTVAIIRATVERMGIKFDRWYAQSELVEGGLSKRTLELLQKNNATLEKDGAIWLKSGVLADDRETVLVKSNGISTYFLDDIAYHWDKLVDRGFAKAVVLLGTNHSGHTPRMRAGLQGIGLEPSRYDGVLYQQVQLKRDGHIIKMAKREGTIVTADEVLDEVPTEVFNYFLLSKSNDTPMDFDLQLAKDTSEKNPVYYVQYAHARIQSVLALGAEKGLTPDLASASTHAYSPAERDLLLWLDRYPSVVEEVAQTYRTHLLPTFAYELANRYHSLYAHQRIVSDNQETSHFLLALSKVTADTLKDVLQLMNIEARKHM